MLPVVTPESKECHISSPPTPSQYKCCNHISYPPTQSSFGQRRFTFAKSTRRAQTFCIAKSALVTDSWCTSNCLSDPPFCPKDMCHCTTRVPTTRAPTKRGVTSHAPTTSRAPITFSPTSTTDSPTPPPTHLENCQLFSETTPGECHELQVLQSAACLDQFWAAQAGSFQTGWYQGVCDSHQYNKTTAYNVTQLCGTAEYPASGNIITKMYTKNVCDSDAGCKNGGNCTNQVCSCEFPYTGALCTQCVAGHFGQGMYIEHASCAVSDQVRVQDVEHAHAMRRTEAAATTVSVGTEVAIGSKKATR